MGSRFDKDRRGDRELMGGEKMLVLVEGGLEESQSGVPPGVQQLFMEQWPPGGVRKLSTTEGCRGSSGLGRGRRASIKAGAGAGGTERCCRCQPGLFALDLVVGTWTGGGGRSVVGEAREDSMEQYGNQFWGEDRRPKAFASEAVSFFVPSCCSARTGCESQSFLLMCPGIPPCYMIVMSRGSEGVAAELRHGRLWRSLKPTQQKMWWEKAKRETSTCVYSLIQTLSEHLPFCQPVWVAAMS